MAAGLSEARLGLGLGLGLGVRVRAEGLDRLGCCIYSHVDRQQWRSG